MGLSSYKVLGKVSHARVITSNSPLTVLKTLLTKSHDPPSVKFRV